MTYWNDRSGQRKWAYRAGLAVAICLAAYVLLAYLVLPKLWAHHEHQPGLEGRPFVTLTAQGIPGDALNVGLVGSKSDVVKAFQLAGWYPADAINLKKRDR